MSTPSTPGGPNGPNPNQPKKPNPTPAGTGPAGSTPTGPKPAAGASGQPAAKNRFAHIDANPRHRGQKLVDLGFIDELQLESVYEDMRTSEAPLGELVVERGLVNADQLLQATAEVHGMRLANLEETKPQPE